PRPAPRSVATSASTTPSALIRALTGKRRTVLTSVACSRSRQPEPGRGATYLNRNAVQTNRATALGPRSRERQWAATGSRGDEAVGEQARSRTAAYYRRNLEQSRQTIGGGECGGKAAGRREGEQQRMLRTQGRVQHVTEAVSLRVLRVWAARPKGTARSTFDKSPVRESRTPGSEGEVPGDRHLYPTAHLSFRTCRCPGGGRGVNSAIIASSTSFCGCSTQACNGSACLSQGHPTESLESITRQSTKLSRNGPTTDRLNRHLSPV